MAHNHAGHGAAVANTREAWEAKGRQLPEGETFEAGVLSYYWPNATYVHCDRVPCKPLELDARIYHGKLPAFLYEEFVTEDDTIVIPCGAPVDCKEIVTPFGPYGPLAMNGSENFAISMLQREVAWHPVKYSEECSATGTYAHAMVSGLACIILLPVAFSYLARTSGGGGKRHRRSGSDGLERGAAGAAPGDASGGGGGGATLASSISALLGPARMAKLYGYTMVAIHLGGIGLALFSAVSVAAEQTALANKDACR